ncbi:cell envelope integrity protein TolA [Luteimonas aquatica]|uniref:cell envelope integrity protein TolA n=1 Tax=Luteimonas aquatica TaxID=450364 RepID=UPI001F58FC81|nr:cell envelope integrity protein TolA [Luteimonas aquatica]
MRETRADTTQGVILALLLHALLFALMFVGLWWTRSESPAGAAGAPVSAELMDSSDLSAAMRRTLQKRPEPVEPEPPSKQPIEVDATPLPQPIPEPNPQDSQVEPQFQAQERIPEPSDTDQEKVERDAISAETREREQEEKRRQEQIDLTERQRQEEIEKKQRLAEQQKQDELKKLQNEMAKAKREADLAEQKLKQIANLRASQASQQQATASATAPPGGPQGVDNALLGRYKSALQEAILRNWTRPDNVPLGQRCRIVIRQLPGGEVIDAKADPSCPYDELGRRSVEAAVLKAQPLPYAGFESVFSRTLNLTFEAQDR